MVTRPLWQISLAFLLCSFVVHAWADSVASLNEDPEDDDEIVTGALSDSDVPEFDRQRGRTPEFGHCYHFKRMDWNAADWIEKDLQDAKWPDPITIAEQKIDRHEWIEIDACARTMMAEIGTEPACNGQGDQQNYPIVLARIIANRQKKVFSETKRRDDPIAAVIFPFKTAVEDKYQFSVWNAGAKIKDGTPCPAKNGANEPTWNEYLSLCKIAVTNHGKFLKQRTSTMTDDMLFYTSGCRMHYYRQCEGYTHQKVEVYPTKVTNYKCFEMWKDNHKRLSPAQQNQCAKQATSCCTPLKKGDNIIPEKQNECDANAATWADAVGQQATAIKK